MMLQADDDPVYEELAAAATTTTPTTAIRKSEWATLMANYRPDKVLKSTNKALIMTRKETLKKDWCKTMPLVQQIRENGCLSRTIINRFCYGQCNSFYIPKGPRRRKFPLRGRNKAATTTSTDFFEDEDLTAPAFKSCEYCQPKKFTWITVTLRCPHLVPQVRRKRIQRIKQCKCSSESRASHSQSRDVVTNPTVQ